MQLNRRNVLRSALGLGAGIVASLTFAYAQNRQPTLQLVSARVHVPGSFTAAQSVSGDPGGQYFFGASQEGALFTLANFPPTYPLIKTIQITKPSQTGAAVPLASVVENANILYITDGSGHLTVFGQPMGQPPTMKTISVAPNALKSLAVDNGTHGQILISKDQGSMAVDTRYVYLSQINQDDQVVALDKNTFALQQTFGQTYSGFTTSVFNRQTGQSVYQIPNPSTNQVNLFANGIILGLTSPFTTLNTRIYSSSTFAELCEIAEPYTNVMVTMNNGRWAVLGTELGTVALYDISNVRNPVLLSRIDLRAVTGHEGADDIEIRSLWISPSGLIVAGSSWGQANNPNLPSMFILKVA